MEHNVYKEQLAELTKAIIHSQGLDQEIAAAKNLSAFYARITPAGSEALHRQKQNEVLLKGGIALSSYDAAICIDEYIRTARFIKGVHLAIVDLLKRFAGQKLNILYAGCGPYATLILPLLPLFDPAQLDVLLLDINEGSLRSVADIIPSVGLQHYAISTLQADAIHYQTPASRPLHLVVSETMFHALIREPQVAITQNLASQLIQGGILVPQEIHIDMVYTFFAKEPYLQPGDERAAKAPYAHRIEGGRLFSINKELTFFKNNSHPGKFESSFYELPAGFDDDCPDLCIFTSLRIYQDIVLGLAESSITNPYGLSARSGFEPHSHIRLLYSYGDVPAWTYELKRQKTN